MTDRDPISSAQRRRRRVIPGRALFGIAIGILTLLGIISPASAAPPGTTVVSSSPSDGSVLNQPPVAIIINFSEEVGEATNVTLTCSAIVVSLPAPTFGGDGRSVTIDLDGVIIPGGTCSIRWVATDDEGAPTETGIITFSVTNQSTGADGTDNRTNLGATTAPSTSDSDSSSPTSAVSVDDFSVSGSGDGAVWLGRFISTTSIAIFFGALILITMAWPEGVEYVVAVRFLRVVWIIAVIGTLLFTAAATGAVTGDGFNAGLSPGTWSELVGSGWADRAVIARLVLIIASGVVAFRPELAIDPATQLWALGIPAMATAMIGITRTIGDSVVLTVLFGAAHSIAMAIWIGGAVLVARVVLSVQGGAEHLIYAVRGFSRISMGAIIATVSTGVVLMVLLAGDDLFGSGYGRVLLLKSIVVAFIVFLAFTARMVVGQRLARSREIGVREADRLRRAFGAEASIGAVALALSAWSLAFTPPSIDDTPKIPYKFSTTFALEEAGQTVLDVTVRLTDDRAGLIGMEVNVDEPDEGLSDLRVVFTAPPNDLLDQIVQPIPVTGRGVAVRLQENGLPFAIAGQWTVQVIATTSFGPVESETRPFILFETDGTAATLFLPQTSLVEVPVPTTTDASG